MKRYVRFTLIILVGISPNFAVSSTISSANSQQQDRIVVRKPWRSPEPVSIVAVKTKNKENIETGKAFAEDDDWLDGFTVTVANNYNKTVTAMAIHLVFRRELGDTRPPMSMDLHFGPSPIAREYVHRDPNRVIKVGKTADLRLSSQNYKILKRDFEQTGYTKSIKQVDLVITEVGFEDGSVFDSGSYYSQDRANPQDPTKKIPVSEPPSGRHQISRSPPAHKNIQTNISFLKASLFLPNPMPVSLTLAKPRSAEDCEEKETPTRTPYCSEECTVRHDRTHLSHPAIGPLSLNSITVKICGNKTVNIIYVIVILSSRPNDMRSALPNPFVHTVNQQGRNVL